MELRPYQVAAADSILTQLSGETTGTLLLLPTGTGKTQVACEAMRRWLNVRPRERALFLAHRDELLQQAERRISQMLGLAVDVEKAESYDQRQQKILLASVQTLSRPGRLSRHKPDAFSLIVIDEIHHATADSYLRVFDHFPEAKRLGLTATATRADGKKLGEEWDSIAYEYNLRTAIADGWLCPIRRKAIYVDSLSLDTVATRAGDLVTADLEARVLESEATIHGFARGILDASGERKVLAFLPGVESSRRLAECLNRYAADEGKEQLAVHLDGETERNTRRLELARFARGEFRVLTNCGLFLEGYDEPTIACIAMCRPTKSHPLYVQMLGRGIRTVPGKTDLLVIDFTTNSQRHDLVTAVDILADGESEEIQAQISVVAAAMPEASFEEILERARQREEARLEAILRAERERQEARSRSGVRAVGSTVVIDIDRDPDAFLGVNRYQVEHRARKWGAKPLTPKQVAILKKNGIKVENSAEGRALARTRLDKIFARMSAGLCSIRQAKLLAKYGLPTEASFADAKRMIDRLAEAKWRPTPAERSWIAAIAARPMAWRS